MTAPGPEQALDHVVVVMFENRSFDNLLGRLYEPGEVPSFEGVIGKDLSNPVPEWLDIGDGPIPYSVATDMNTPSPDPGEEFHHINTQLFGLIDECQSRQATIRSRPTTRHRRAGMPSMDGFVTDYASMLTFENGRPPSRDEVARIMTGYTPEQIPVLSGLARGFATFDHWFCDVPSCTFPNRSFFHAGTSSGFVTNFPPSKFPDNNNAETLFDRLDAAGLSWRVYCDPPCHASLTGIIHAARLRSKFATNFMSTEQFFIDCETGNLPTYTFIEPQIIGWGHNDMHPPFTHLFKAIAKDKGIDPGDITADPPSSILGGEELLSRIYNAVRSSHRERLQPSQHDPARHLRRARRHLRPRSSTRSSGARPEGGTRRDGIHLRPGRRPHPHHRGVCLDPRTDRDHRRTPRDVAAGDHAHALEPR